MNQSQINSQLPVTSTEIQKRHQKQLIFGISLIAFQILISFLYGFCSTAPPQYINIASILITILLILLVAVGFGLYFCNIRYLMWSSIGGALFVIAVCMQLYPLINAFWTKVGIFSNPVYHSSFKEKQFFLFLSNFDSIRNTGNTISQSIRCSLTIFIGFSGIIGRSSSLETFILTILATITFELNRQIAAQIGLDSFGSFTIFGFGGFLSLGCGIVYAFRQRVLQKKKSNLYSGSVQISLTLLGSVFIFVFCPLLAFEGDNSMKNERFTAHNTVLSLILSMGAGIGTSASVSMFFDGKRVRIRDVQNGLLASIVVGGTASYYITNPAFSIICGFSGGLLQTLFDNFLEKKIYNKFGIICSFPPFVFAFQSIIGGIFTSIYCKRVNDGLSNDIFYTINATTPRLVFAVCFISAGIGLITGIVVGLLSYLLNSHINQKMFDDRYYWITNDGLQREDKYKNQTVPSVPGVTTAVEPVESQLCFQDPNLWKDIS